MSAPEDFTAQLARAAEAAVRHGDELRARPGVVGVGAGPERTGGRLTGRAAVVVSVREKHPPGELARRGQDLLPDEVDGVPVDVAVLSQEPGGDSAERERLAQAKAVKDRIAGEWLREPNVTGVGVGRKYTGGRPTDQIAVQFSVERKLPAEEVTARSWRLVPDEVEGLPTDVFQAGPFRHTTTASGTRDDRKDPLVGGVAVGYGSDPFSWGTLGAVVFAADGTPMALSNEHVLDGDIGDTVHQPSPVRLDDSVEIEFQLDVCNPTNVVRLDTPDTLGGTILAGSAVAAATAAALSDLIDPIREGQEATPPPEGAQTHSEQVSVHVDYPAWPLPGTAFQLTAGTSYERHLGDDVLSHAARHRRTNPHVLLFHRLFTDNRHYTPGGTILLFGVVVAPEPDIGVTAAEPRGGLPPLQCERYHCVALLHPHDRDSSYPVVLRPVQDEPDSADLFEQFMQVLADAELTDEERELIDRHLQRLCLYVGAVPAAGLPLGEWSHWMHVQTVNTVPPGTDPLEAAQTIGGLPLSHHYRSTVDLACGPFVFDDDGTFDIEPISST